MATKAYWDYTQKELDAMTPEQRAWNALDYSYGQQREDAAREYAQAYSKTDNQLLGRGMQRSSYGAQTLANLKQKGIEARNKITGQQNAAYSEQRYQIERDKESDRRWQAQFAQTYVNQILEKGGTPSDALLKQAGLSRADYNAMAQGNGGGGWGGGGDYSYGGGGGYGKKKTKDTDTSGSDSDFNKWLDKVGQGHGKTNIWAGYTPPSTSSSSGSGNNWTYKPNKLKSSSVVSVTKK